MKRFIMTCKGMLLMTLRDRATLFWNLAFPIFLLLIYSMVFSRGTVGNVNYMAWVIPGVLVFNILAFGLISSGAQMTTLREGGALNRLRASPLPASQLVGSYLLIYVLIGILQCALILIFSVLVYDFPLDSINLLMVIPMLVLAILSSVAIGQSISALVVSAGAIVAVAQIFNFSQMFITDLVMPLEMMPDWIQKIAPYLPAYAVVRLVRPPLLEGVYGPETLTSLLILIGYTSIAVLLAARFFRWEPRKA